MADLAELGIKIDSKQVLRARDSLGRFTKAAAVAEKSSLRYERAAKRAGRASLKLAAAVGAAVAAYVGFRVIKSVIQEIREYEKALVGVGKTSDITGKELESLGRGVVAVSKDIKVSEKVLLEAAQAAGQMGVKGSDNILKFTKVIGQLGRASNLSGEDAAITLARLQTVTGETAETVDVLGSVIVRLGTPLEVRLCRREEFNDVRGESWQEWI